MGSRVRERLPARARLAGLDALLATSLLWFLAKFLRYSFPPLFGQFRDLYGVSNAVVGAAFTGLMLAYAGMQFPSGALADRLGAVRVVTVGAALAGVGAVVVGGIAPAAKSFAVLVGGMLLIGVGTGVHKTVAVTLLSTVHPERTGRALGVLDTFGAFGGVVAPAAVAAAAATADWRAVFLGGGVAAAALAAAFVRRVPRRLPDDTGSDADADADTDADVDAADGEGDVDTATGDGGGGGGVRRYVALFRDGRFAAFFGVTVLFSFAYNGAVAFLPLYLTDAVGLRSSVANLVYGAVFAVSLVQLATGELSDRFGRLPTVTATLGLATVGLCGLLVARSPAGLGTAAVAFGLGSHGFRPVRGAYLVAVIPDAVAGGTLGVVRTGLMGAGALAPAAVGVVSARTGYAAAFGVLAAAVAGAFALAGALLLRGGRGASPADA